jgi:signal transduction histidine kinase
MREFMTDAPKILIVDDEPTNFDVIEILLFRDGYEFYYQDSAKAAITCLDNMQPDVILLDVMMPEIDGIDLCQQIKSNSHWQHIPIIFVTALSDKEDLARCFDAGADDFISKPINSTELRARVRSMLRIKAQSDHIKKIMALRQEMMQAIVHDLRNPLIGISLGCDSLAGLEMPERAQRRIGQIRKSTEQMRLLVDDILTIGRIESNKLTLNCTDIDVIDLVKSVIANFELITAQKQIQLLTEFPFTSAHIFGDLYLIRRVLENLIDNAIKFSPQLSSIILGVESLRNDAADHQNLIRIQVIDQGLGINDEQKQAIFGKYVVGNIVSGVSQIGLGLSFCKMIIEAHEGIISVANNQPRGSIFTILLSSKPNQKIPADS